jgi:hypothetical protein
VDPEGPLYPLYRDDLSPNDQSTTQTIIRNIQTNFNEATRGAGLANTIAQCLYSVGCCLSPVGPDAGDR